MIDGDFEVDGSAYGPGTGVVIESVTPSVLDWRTQDSLNPVGGNRYFGRDHVSGPTWTLGLGAHGGSVDAALTNLGRLAAVWNKPLTVPGAETVLRYRLNGRVRRLFGRCRGVNPNPNYTLPSGYVNTTAEFVTADAFHYSDTLQSSGRLTLLPPPSGGVKLPATLPFTLAESAPTNGSVVVGGDAPAPVEIFVHGPLTGVWAVTVGGYRVQMDHSMAYDRWLTIDTRKMTVLADDGANLSGKLSRKVFLPDVRLDPGPAEINFEGASSNGTAYAEVQFRDTHYGF